jgi:uncharacterized membrane protein
MTVFLQFCDEGPQAALLISAQTLQMSAFKADRFALEALLRIWRRSSMNGPDLIGLIGVAAYLAAYGLLQLGTLKVEDNRYALLNAIGALLILYSLFFDFNLASFVTQSAWLLLTAVGVIRSRGRRGRAAQT